MDFYASITENLKNSKKIKESSIKAYLQNIKKISKELFNSTKPNILFFKDYTSVFEYLDNIPTLATRKGIATSIIVILKADKSFSVKYPDILKSYSEYHKKLASQQNDSYLDNEKTDKEEKNWVTNEEIQTKIKEMYKKIAGSAKGTVADTRPETFKGTDRKYADLYQQYLILNLYTMLPPIRNDYSLCKMIRDSEDNPEKCDQQYNYINTTTSKLFLCNYKTQGKYGIKDIDIPEELLKIIKKFENIKKKVLNYYGDFFLINTTNLKPMLKNSLTKYINKIFLPKKVSTTILRKSYLSWRFPVQDSMREKIEVARIMGHSVDMAQKVYSKK